MLAGVNCPKCGNIELVTGEDVIQKAVKIDGIGEVEMKMCLCTSCNTQLTVQVDNERTKSILKMEVSAYRKAHANGNGKTKIKARAIDSQLVKERNELMQACNGKTYYEGIAIREVICAKSNAASV